MAHSMHNGVALAGLKTFFSLVFQLYLGIVLSAVVLVTGIFSYYQVCGLRTLFEIGIKF